MTKFKEWKVLVENQTSNKIKVLTLEFCNTEFDQYCTSEGILRHKTVRNTPQQNGVAERMNRTLLEKIRCLLFSSELPRAFWGEALNTATHLINLSPNSSVQFKTPEEIWSGRAHKLAHLRVFGCEAYAHQSIGKLEPRSIKCVFL